MDWPADKVERWAVNRLIPFAKNARTHSDEQVAQIAASIREWGFTTRFWSAGNQRHRLASSRALVAVTLLYRSDTLQRLNKVLSVDGDRLAGAATERNRSCPWDSEASAAWLTA